jgi:ABC-type transporter Mla maintaining outer membrane lipid asymmetry ATPase subunit MlaF
MVDPLSARVLVSLIGLLKQELKLTNIVVTHDMRVVEQLADRVVFQEQKNR